MTSQNRDIHEIAYRNIVLISTWCCQTQLLQRAEARKSHRTCTLDKTYRTRFREADTMLNRGAEEMYTLLYETEHRLLAIQAGVPYMQHYAACKVIQLSYWITNLETSYLAFRAGGVVGEPTTPTLWSCDAVTLWCCDSVMMWLCDAVTLWCCDAVTLWYCDSVVLWYCDPVTLWSFDSVILWLCETVTLWCCDTVTLWCCYSVTWQQCKTVTFVTMSQSGTVTSCYNIWPVDVCQ